MNKLSLLLALNGTIVLFVTMASGLWLSRAIIRDRPTNDWHLLHAGGTSRGIMLIALAATIHLPSLPSWQSWWAAGLIIVFVWTSILAMLVRAVTGESGFGFSGSIANKIVFLMYAIGTLAVFTGFGWLIYGLIIALKV